MRQFNVFSDTTVKSVGQIFYNVDDSIAQLRELCSESCVTVATNR